jgi:hypothetical protein
MARWALRGRLLHRRFFRHFLNTSFIAEVEGVTLVGGLLRQRVEADKEAVRLGGVGRLASSYCLYCQG